MKITTYNKNIIISLIILIVLILTLYLNCKVFIIDDNFNSILFLFSIVLCLIIFFLFSIKIKATDKQNIIISIISLLFSILFSYITVELLNQNTLFNLHIKRLIFNFIVIILLHLFIFALTNRINVTIIISNLITFLLGIINYVIVCFRGTSFTPLDVLSIKTAMSVATTYILEINHYFLLAIIIFVLAIAIALKANYKFKKGKQNLLLRISFIVIVIALISIFYNTNIISYFSFHSDLFDQEGSYKLNGFLANFIKQTKNIFVNKPDNYSIDAIENIISQNDYYNNSVEVNEETPNIIVIMNESFSDLSINGSFNTSEDYMPFFNSLKENTIRGNVNVSVLGGGTANSEWEFLTNNTMGLMPYSSVPFQQYIKTQSYSLATILKDQGYVTTAFHPWYASGYRRNISYSLLGFDSFDSIETLNNYKNIRCYPSDLSTYEHIIKQFENKNENKKMFNFTVTMQNHGSYDTKDYDSTVFLTNTKRFPKVEQYLSLIKESDNALKYLINYFENYEEKTIILFFGDHQPGHLENAFFKTIMENYKDSSSKYITPFIIWANYDIEEKYIDKISLNYLSILLLETAELQTTPYMNFLKTVYKDLPIITANGYIDNNRNRYTFEDTNKYSEILNKYNLIQYNNVFDDKNRINSFFEIN